MPEPDSKALARKCAEFCLAKKAHDVCLLDLRGLTSMTDFFVVCHGDSDVQVKAVADAVVEGAGREGFRIWHCEGYEHRSWILLDYVDVVVHIFRKEERTYYNLERLWGDAPSETVQDKP
jgi:ribosome-associated protein